MSGPCSLPNGSSRMEYAEQWFLVCDNHKDCTPDMPDATYNHHEFIFKREWLARRNKLRTGKTR